MIRYWRIINGNAELCGIASTGAGDLVNEDVFTTQDFVGTIRWNTKPADDVILDAVDAGFSYP